MCKFKFVGMMVLIVFAMSIVLVGDAVAAEKGKVAGRQVFHMTAIQTLKVPDVEGHTLNLIEAKGIFSSEKWGAGLLYQTYTMDVIKGAGTFQGYVQTTYSDGSTTTSRFEGKSTGGGVGTTGSASSEATFTYVKGTGKFQGIQGGGRSKTYIVAPGQYYADIEGEYTLP